MSIPKFVHYNAELSSNDNPNDNVLVRLEKLFLYLFRSKDSEKIYQNFDDQLKTYLNKISGNSKDICLQLLNRKAMLMSVNPKKLTNILGTYVSSESNKLLFVAAEISIFDIDVLDGTIGNIEELVNQYYYQFIRATIRSFPEISKNMDLHYMVIQIYSYLLMKTLRIPTLVDKKVELLKYITGILYLKHFVKMDFNLAKEKVLPLIDSKLQKEIISTVPDALLTKYNDIKDILKLVIDLKLVFDTPNNLTYQMLSQLKVVSFLSITSTFDHLIASLIAALTSVEYYKPLLINKQLQEKLEANILQYANKMKYEEISKFSISSVNKEITNDTN